MDNLELNNEFFQNKNFKSFIRVGQTFVDIKQTIGFSFINNPDGYIIIQFVYDSGRALNAFLNNRNEFAQFLLELDKFIDDKSALSSINDFINEIEYEFKINTQQILKKRNKKKHNKQNKKGSEF